MRGHWFRVSRPKVLHILPLAPDRSWKVLGALAPSFAPSGEGTEFREKHCFTIMNSELPPWSGPDPEASLFVPRDDFERVQWAPKNSWSTDIWCGLGCRVTETFKISGVFGIVSRRLVCRVRRGTLLELLFSCYCYHASLLLPVKFLVGALPLPLVFAVRVDGLLAKPREVVLWTKPSCSKRTAKPM
jgi:hypothetical protein